MRLPMPYTPAISAVESTVACPRLAAYGAATSSTAQTTDAVMNAQRSGMAAGLQRGMRTPNGTLSRHDRSVAPAPRRRRARLGHAPDDRAGAHAHLLGRHVLPLRI